MQREKEKWAEEVLNSTDGMTKATAPDMTGAVLSRVNQTRGISLMPKDKTFMWRIAASVTILLVLNVVSIYTYQNHVLKARNEQQAQAAAMVFGLGQSSGDASSAIFGN